MELLLLSCIHAYFDVVFWLGVGKKQGYFCCPIISMLIWYQTLDACLHNCSSTGVHITNCHSSILFMYYDLLGKFLEAWYIWQILRSMICLMLLHLSLIWFSLGEVILLSNMNILLDLILSRWDNFGINFEIYCP